METWKLAAIMCVIVTVGLAVVLGLAWLTVQ